MLRSKRVKIDVEKIKGIDFNRRNTIRNLSEAIGVSKSTVWRWKNDGYIKSHTNAIKPMLTDANMLQRLKFSVSALTFDSQEGVPKFKPMTQVVHIDEKWFYITKTSGKYYLCDGEEEPYRACQSKRFITKVMFLCAISRPLYSSDGECVFDGKIGMWPFTKTELAKRNSKNRKAGDPVTKPMESINKEVTKHMMINQVVPAIKSKWPNMSSKDIIIQWDNAPPHIKNDDPEFRVAASADGFNIQLQFQPPNSPDTNINDLGWFRSLDAVKRNTQASNIDDLVKAVLYAFVTLSHRTLNKLFISLQSCMIEIMMVRGRNNYKVPHLGKDALERRGLLPIDLVVDSELVIFCVRYLQEVGQGDEFEGIMDELELVHLSL